MTSNMKAQPDFDPVANIRIGERMPVGAKACCDSQIEYARHITVSVDNHAKRSSWASG